MVVSTKAIYESGTLRLLEKLDLQEGQEVCVTIEQLDEDGYPVQETLADVLGFDPDDEEKARELADSQHKAIMELLESLADLPGSEPPHDGSVNHDRYIYQVDWR
jgi:predicted DNA-binding antitoxin AbrB/MazE fold protein